MEVIERDQSDLKESVNNAKIPSEDKKKEVGLRDIKVVFQYVTETPTQEEGELLVWSSDNRSGM